MPGQMEGWMEGLMEGWKERQEDGQTISYRTHPATTLGLNKKNTAQLAKNGK